jgi:hypothetical protein
LLQNKVLEAIPELARANHGLHAQFQPAFMHPLMHQNSLTINDVYTAPVQHMSPDAHQQRDEQKQLPFIDVRSHQGTTANPFGQFHQINPNQGEIVFPITITKILDSKEAQMQFIID